MGLSRFNDSWAFSWFNLLLFIFFVFLQIFLQILQKFYNFWTVYSFLDKIVIKFLAFLSALEQKNNIARFALICPNTPENCQQKFC